MLILEDFTAGNWSKVKDKVLFLENTFPKPIASTEQEIEEVIFEGGAFGKFLSVDTEFVGSIMGYFLEDEGYEGYDLPIEYKGKGAAYIFSIAVHPDHQGKGYGSKLLNEALAALKNKGCNIVLGHYRRNSSYNMIKKLGAKDILICNNWEMTGEDFVLCELDLREMKVS